MFCNKDYIYLSLFLILFVMYFKPSSVKKDIKKIKENMTDTSQDIKNAVAEVYQVDIQAIRNLAEVAEKLQGDGLTLPGNLKVEGTLTVDKKLTVNDDTDLNP